MFVPASSHVHRSPRSLGELILNSLLLIENEKRLFHFMLRSE
jgi:hypothetical protein